MGSEMRIVGVLVAFLLTAQLAFAPAHRAFACSCLPVEDIQQEQVDALLNRSDAVLQGRLESISNDDDGRPKFASLAVERVFAGDVGSTVKVTLQGSGGSCQDFMQGYLGEDGDRTNDAGKQFLLGLRTTPEDSIYAALDCSSFPLASIYEPGREKRRDLLALLEQLPPRETTSEESSSANLVFASAISIGVIALGATAYVYRRQHRA